MKIKKCNKKVYGWINFLSYVGIYFSCYFLGMSSNLNIFLEWFFPYVFFICSLALSTYSFLYSDKKLFMYDYHEKVSKVFKNAKVQTGKRRRK